MKKRFLPLERGREIFVKPVTENGKKRGLKFSMGTRIKNKIFGPSLSVAVPIGC